MGCVYMLTAPDGKQYIGATRKTAQERFVSHVNRSRYEKTPTLICAALRESDADEFVVETLLYADDYGYLLEMESKAIKAFKTLEPSGLNKQGAESHRKIIADRSRYLWAHDYERRKAASKIATDAMADALKDPIKAEARRVKIVGTMKTKGIGRGEANAMAILTDALVREIKISLCTGITQAALASQYSVSRSLIGLIGQGKRWSHVTI